jgi:hypothetical protein
MKKAFGTPVPRYLPAVGLGLITLAFLVTGYTYPKDARAFPAAIAWTLLVLTGLDLIAVSDTAAGALIRRWFNPGLKTAEVSEPASRQACALLSLAAVALALVLLGIEITVPLYVFLSLRFGAGRSLVKSFVITAAVCAAMWLLFVFVLHLDLYQGYLLTR